MTADEPRRGATGERSLLRHGSVYTAAVALHLGAAAVALPVATRALAPEQLGEFATALVILQLVTAGAALGLQAAVAREYYEGDAGPRDAERVVGWVLVLSVIVAVAVDQFGPVWVGVLEGAEYTATFRFAVAAAVPAVLTQAVLAILRSRGRPRSYAAVALIGSAGGQALGTTLIVVVRDDPALYMSGLLVAHSVAAGVGLLLARPAFRGGSARLLRRALRTGLPLVPHLLAWSLLAAGDRFVIERILGFEQVGRYHVAYVLGGLTMVVIAAINNAWAPMMLEASDRDRVALLRRTGLVVSGLATAGALLACLLAPTALAIASPETYRAGELSSVVAIVALSAIPYVWYLGEGNVLYQRRRTGVFAVLTPLAAAVNISLNLVLIPRFGLTGAATATFLGVSVLAAGAHVRRRLLAPETIWPHARFIPVPAIVVGLLLDRLPTTGAAGAIRWLGTIAVVAAAVVLLRSWWVTAAGAPTRVQRPA
ncbi:lipopolysaccharide biosynthesis protein [Nitriliruptor alkaliphilus]|uniref:lipopolysaccharide biosynthesis protein n=1 Tax=Nitriliruptor alkaliphilus TaxID=427918 RepID=UPI0006960D73|nr:lipopolysaccharide biosynthesis protein [Nitriliruptor alkaliphilus]